MARLTVVLVIAFSAFTSLAQDTYVIVGSGGGVTGSLAAFKITPDGKVLKGRGVADIQYTECARMKRTLARRNIATAAEHLKELASINRPGNIYYVITYHNKDIDQTMTWGDPEHLVPSKVIKFYDDLQKEISLLKFKPIKLY